jgi:hypothetical protein
MYLRCLTGDRPRDWLRWLPWAEFCYNSSFQSSLYATAFQVVYGHDPPSMHAYSPGKARLLTVECQMREHDEFLAKIQDQLEQAQLQYKSFYICKHQLVEFTVGAWVWLRFLHRPMASVNVQGRGKLGPKFYGPFLITECIDDVAYRLQLPVGAKLHDVFHIGLLKKYNDDPPLGPSVLPSIRHGCACPVPGPVIRGCLARGHRELLMH